ncbi:KAP family P-loop NTPase fold protein [Pedobacter hiemivivus]|uniref:KAP NTPase domain-containing protein n=1 Tax=Pedobacter hiemivivus TaxID=2530454 RepID=A0A4V2MKS0_9SPHI|nr:P-loop NTPase fold protein [Pedobacter hiemivivus]TCC99166.1 hypothetical protein EZ444_00330 [Pedobacter hiemivivus]
MWNDNETDEDLIDCGHLVTAVSNIVDSKNLLPCSIGIFGDWGSGKSSLMRMIENKYSAKPDILVIKFNGWLFEGYEDAKIVLMSKIVDAIVSERTLSEKAISFAAKLLRNIDVIKAGGQLVKYGIGFAAGGPVGMAAVSALDIAKKASEADYTKLLKENKSKLKEDDVKNNIQSFHENFSNLLSETDLDKVLICIDDLDRCSPPTVIGTLEAIKLFLFTKKTAFIIGADERLIKHAVKTRFPEISGDNAEVGRDYLEKLIQFPIRIPPLNATELTNYANLLFAQLHTDEGEFGIAREEILKEKRNKGFDFLFDMKCAGDFLNTVNDELSEALLMCGQIVPVLSVGLNGNPRQCKRFLNTLLLRKGMADSIGIDLKKTVLAKLMLLEYFKPETFRNFYEMQANNQGAIQILDQLEEKNEEQNSNVSQKSKPELEIYQKDKWLINWFKLEPALSGIDLSPYFYFSRDHLSVVSSTAQRLSPEASVVVQKLFSNSKAERNVTLGKLGDLAPADITAVFALITERFRQEEDHSGDLSYMELMFDYASKRSEVKSELITLLGTYPEKGLPAKAATLVARTFKQTEFQDPAIKLLKKWEKSTSNTKLIPFAQKAIKDLNK